MANGQGGVVLGDTGAWLGLYQGRERMLIPYTQTCQGLPMTPTQLSVLQIKRAQGHRPTKIQILKHHS